MNFIQCLVAVVLCLIIEVYLLFFGDPNSNVSLILIGIVIFASVGILYSLSKRSIKKKSYNWLEQSEDE
jgi:1,4-dihydroxy-2-naphthoate octaprenyltransferase